MMAILLILFPLLAGFGAFFLKDGKAARSVSLLVSLLTLAVSLLGLTLYKEQSLAGFDAPWIPALGSRFTLRLDGFSQLLVLLNAIAYPLVFLATWHRSTDRPGAYYGWMLLAQAGMMGVFLAADALLFYFFWELALIPMYFLASGWGGERRIPVTFKFFVYTFLGSILMLVALIFLYQQTPDHSFSWKAFSSLSLNANQQSLAFWLMFAAFAIKMPLFPLHTWQPDAYEQAPTPTTMILSGVMVKMGVYGLLRWVFPVVTGSSYLWGDVATSLAVAGMIYASLIALRQDDLKRLVAYSSIAHIGLLGAGLFTQNAVGLQGVMLQVFSHGINIIGLWMIVEWIERNLGTRKISELGGLAQTAPSLAIFLVIISLANIALPLTNAFVGEFLIFNGLLTSLTKYYVVFTVLAGVCIILAAAYMLRMVRKVLYGETNALTAAAPDLRWNEKLALTLVVLLIIWTGIQPQPLLNLTAAATDGLVNKFEVLRFAVPQ